MKEHKHLKHRGDLNKSATFIEIKTQGEKHPKEISIENFLDFVKLDKNPKYKIEKDIDNYSIVIDPSTLKIKINENIFVTSNVFSESYNNQNILYNHPPVNSSTLTGVHLVMDENYLYVWTKNRWKRVALSEW